MKYSKRFMVGALLALVAVVVNGCQVAKVNWHNATYFTQFPFVGAHAPIPVALHNGAGHFTFVQGGYKVPVAVNLAQVNVSELTRDHDTDVAIWLGASYGAGSADSEIQVFTGTKGALPPKFLGRLVAPPNASVGLPGGYYLPQLFKMWVSNGDIYGRVAYWVGTDSHASPSRQLTIHWRWNGLRFVRV